MPKKREKSFFIPQESTHFWEFLIAAAVFGTVMGFANSFGSSLFKGTVKKTQPEGNVLKEGVQ